MRRLFNAATLLLVPFMLAACAASTTGGMNEGDVAAQVDEDRVQLRVVNNHPDGSIATLFVVPAVGVRRQLGDVPYGETQDFQYEFPNRGNYRLLAVYPGGTERRSDEFRVAGGELVTWETRGSRATVRRR